MLILNLIAETSERGSSILAVNAVTTLTVCHRIVQFIYDYTKQEVHVVWIGLRACGFNLQLEWVAPSDPSQVRYLADRSWCTAARPRYRGPLQFVTLDRALCILFICKQLQNLKLQKQIFDIFC